MQSVKVNWADPDIAKQLATTYELVFDLIHFPRLQPAVREINGYITSNKKKKTIAAGQKANKDLTGPIINLEKMIEQTIRILEKNQ